ncbi:MAG: (Fe-S)-binding protein [Promethearchaeota archaeon]
MTESKEKKNIDSKTIENNIKIIQEIKNSANYCYNCNRCVNVCPLSHVGQFNPRKLILDLVHLDIEKAIMENDIWECLTCGQCTIYCPMTKDNEGVNIPNLILKLREIFSQSNSEIEKIAKCETHDGIIPLISDIMVENPNPPNKLDFLEGTGLKIKDNGDIAYFLGCLPLMNDIIYNFDVDYIKSAKTIIALLNEAGITPVVLNEKCCGHDILWGKGDFETFKKLAEYNVNLYREAGVKKIIFGCAEGYQTWKYEYPKLFDKFDFEIIHFSEFLLELGILDTLRFPQEREIIVTYHDACRLGRMGDKLYDAPRELLRKLPGIKLVEMKNIKDDALCCGVSAFSCCNEFTKIIRKNRIEEAINTGADYLIVSCPKCLTHFNCYLSEPALSIRRKIKVVDLFGFIGDLLFLT